MNSKRVQFCELNDEQKDKAFAMLLKQGLHDLLISNVDVKLDSDGNVIEVLCLHRADGLYNETWDTSGKYEDQEMRRQYEEMFEYTPKEFLSLVRDQGQLHQLLRDARIIEERLTKNPELAEKVRASTILYMETFYEVNKEYFLATMVVEWFKGRFICRLSWIKSTRLTYNSDRVIIERFYRPN